MAADPSDAPANEMSDPSWFRAPSPREHRIAATLFVGFGVFFVLLFLVLSGWWFRWVILMLGGISIVHGLRHAINSHRQGGRGSGRAASPDTRGSAGASPSQ